MLGRCDYHPGLAQRVDAERPSAEPTTRARVELHSKGGDRAIRVGVAAVVTLLVVSFAATAARAASKNVWVSGADIAAAPTTGTAWTKVSADAELAKTCVPSLTVLNDDCDVDTLAAAYKAVRLNDATLYQAVQNRIGQLPTTPTDRALELARNL